MKKILLLGSRELGKGFMISAQCKGQYVIACDSYAGAPAMQIAGELEIFDMLGGEALERVVEEYHPDIIIPEIEAIRTERLYGFEEERIQIVSSTRAVSFTINREAIRDLATKEFGLKTVNYFYTKTLDELKEAAIKIGFPCVVRPLMSSPGKGQSLVKSADEFEHVWECGCNDSRSDIRELIIEEFIKFDSEITLFTVTQKSEPTLFYPPIGYVQKGGNYRESFQPAHVNPAHLKETKEMTEKVTHALTDAGFWGVEFFLSHENRIYFSELSSRPHDTGMVTLTGAQNLSESELHLRAVLDLPVPGIKQERISVSAVILSPIANQEHPQYRGMEEVTKEEDTYLHIFDKPLTRVDHRVGVVLCYVPLNSDLNTLYDKAKRVVEKVGVY